MDEQRIIILDALAYLFSFIYWTVKIRKINAGLLILFIMTISHIGAILYYSVLSELGLIQDTITIMPFIFLYSVIIINLYPFLKHEGIKSIDVSGYEKYIYILSLIIILFNFEPFIENINVMLSSKSDYSEMYEDMREGFSSIYSELGERLMRWSNYFRLFVPISFFYYLSQKEKDFTILAGLFMCMINYVLYWVNLGGRGGILSQFLMYLLCYLLFLPTFPDNMLRYMKRVLLIMTIPLIMVFAAITVSRFEGGSSNKSLVEWLLLYTSEGPIKFNNEMWNGEHNTNGDVNLCYLKSILGLKTFTTFEERDDYYLAKNGRRIEVFYTYVGDFVSDFGIFGALVTCFVLYLLLRRTLLEDGIVPFHYMFYILFVAHMLSIGFASNIYRSNNMQKGCFFMLLIFIFLARLYNPDKENLEEETDEKSIVEIKEVEI